VLRFQGDILEERVLGVERRRDSVIGNERLAIAAASVSVNRWAIPADDLTRLLSEIVRRSVSAGQVSSRPQRRSVPAGELPVRSGAIITVVATIIVHRRSVASSQTAIVAISVDRRSSASSQAIIM